MPDLKPCPSCGSACIYLRETDAPVIARSSWRRYQVVCNYCGTSGPIRQLAHDATGDWNALAPTKDALAAQSTAKGEMPDSTAPTKNSQPFGRIVLPGLDNEPVKICATCIREGCEHDGATLDRRQCEIIAAHLDRLARIEENIEAHIGQAPAAIGYDMGRLRIFVSNFDQTVRIEMTSPEAVEQLAYELLAIQRVFRYTVRARLVESVAFAQKCLEAWDAEYSSKGDG